MVKIDMEMPTYCSDCPCHNGENGRCNITGETNFDKRPFDCPLKEVKHGHWFVDERPESDREIICSNCEQPIFKYHKIDFDYRPKYCPNCGAKMDKEENE